MSIATMTSWDRGPYFDFLQKLDLDPDALIAPTHKLVEVVQELFEISVYTFYFDYHYERFPVFQRSTSDHEDRRHFVNTFLKHPVLCFLWGVDVITVEFTDWAWIQLRPRWNTYKKELQWACELDADKLYPLAEKWASLPLQSRYMCSITHLLATGNLNWKGSFTHDTTFGNSANDDAISGRHASRQIDKSSRKLSSDLDKQALKIKVTYVEDSGTVNHEVLPIAKLVDPNLGREPTMNDVLMSALYKRCIEVADFQHGPNILRSYHANSDPADEVLRTEAALQAYLSHQYLLGGGQDAPQYRMPGIEFAADDGVERIKAARAGWRGADCDAANTR